MPPNSASTETMTDHPEVLYKYFRPQRAAVLANLELCFARLSTFNDPFEGRPYIRPTLIESVRSKLAGAFDDLDSRYDDLDAGLRGKLSRESFKQAMRAMGPSFIERKSLEALPIFDRAMRDFAGQVEKNLGVLCLTEEHDHPLMWAHYAESHTGFVIAFDAANAFFDRRVSAKDELRHLRRVRYRNRRPAISTEEASGADLLFCKSDHWAYEKEWRMALPLTAADNILSLEAGPVHLYRYPPEAMKAVYLGMRASPETEKTLRASLASLPALAHVTLHRMELDEIRYELNDRPA